MKEHETLIQIGKTLEQAETVLLFPHVLMDGDAMGSSVALCRALRHMGKKAYILIEDKVPEYLAFLDKGYCTDNLNIVGSPDVSVCVDCTDPERFPLRKERFLSGALTICIDHHVTAKYFAQMNHVEPGAAATGEVVYKLLRQMNAPVDKETAEAVYAAIITDTGNFQYSNTTKETHLLAASLMDLAIDHSYVSRMIYQNQRVEKLLLSGKILATLKMLAEGQAAMAYVSREMLSEIGALMEDAEGSSELLRSIGGVEMSVFAKETAPGETRFSMRAKAWANVSEIAAGHGGGGHVRAAGCTVMLPLQEACRMMEAEIEAYFAAHQTESKG